MRSAILLPIVLMVAMAGLPGCDADPQQVSLTQLAGQQIAYDGRDVVTTGVLRTHDTPRHYWIADAADHRVELQAEEDLAALVGERLSVRGRFRYAAESGRRIEVVRVLIVTGSDSK